MDKIKNRIPASFLISVFCAAGFTVGVLAIAFFQENWLINEEILNQEFIYELEKLKIDKRAMFFLCLGKRSKAFFLLFLLAFSSVNIVITMSFFLINSFYVGSILEVLAIRYGMQGIAMYFTMIFPQGIFYCLGFGILGCWCLNQEGREGSMRNQKLEKIKRIRNKKALMISMFLVLLGIITESYVNPKLFLFFI